MNRYLAVILCSAIIISAIPSIASAQTAERKTPRKYDKLLTAVESFAKLNAQIEIRESEFKILAPFIQDAIFYTNDLKTVCDLKCYKTSNTYYSRLKTSLDALNEAHRRYQAMTPNITERNAALMSEIKRVMFVPGQQSQENVIASLNRLNLENLYHYKAYANTYHSADTAMLSLAASSDVTTIVNSFASTTDRLVKSGRAQPGMNATIGNLKSKIPDIRARIKVLEDRRKSLVCAATLASDWSVDVRCLP
jgi:hypothetical protein